MKEIVFQITNIAKTTQNKDYLEFSHRILQAFDYIESIGVPPIERRSPKLKSFENNEIMLSNIVKDLENHPPLLELRVNWKPIGAFRAIFFSIKTKEREAIYFTKAVIKKSTYSKEFEEAVKESEEMMFQFLHKGGHDYV